MKCIQGFRMSSLRAGHYLLAAYLTIGFNCTLCVHAQNIVDIGNTQPDQSVQELSVAENDLMVPSTDTSLVSNPAKGMLIFQNTDTQFYYFDGIWWRQLKSKVSAMVQAPFSIDDMDNPENTWSRSEFVLKYPEGWTEESYTEEDRKILKRVLVKDGHVVEYRMVTQLWGERFYFKNDNIIPRHQFEKETAGLN
jgi:hypothetical protein